MTEKRLEKSVELDARPEEVWAAIATGPGISSWFVPTEVDADGVVRQDFGGMVASGRVHARDEGERFVYGAAEGEGTMAFAFLVEARDGGGTVLRLVQSGFSAEGWEDEYDGYDTGWTLFLHNLREVLTHFPGRPVRNAVATVFSPRSPADLWPVLLAALGLSGRPAVGDEVTLRPDGPAPVTGVVDVATGAFLGVRSASGLHRIGVEGGPGGCGVSAYHYDFDPDRAVDPAAWSAWLAGVVPA